MTVGCTVVVGTGQARVDEAGRGRQQPRGLLREEGSRCMADPVARQQGKHVMIGGVDADNEPSLRFHERLGFTRVAHLREVGFKFGRWLDLIFVQRILEP